MRVTCIADEDTVRGMRLAGITGHVAATPREAAEAMRLALADTNVGIIILTRQVADGIRTQVESVRLGRDHPLIAEITGPGEPVAEQKSLRQSVQEAIGIRLDFQEAPP